jgi:sec-independent protein translocase protein TatA
MPFNIGPFELILILVVLLILFGPGKLPDIGKAIGRGVSEFRKASNDLENAVRLDNPPAAKPEQSDKPVAGTPPDAPGDSGGATK